MNVENFESMHVYAWAQPMFVSYIDMLGFQAALDHSPASQNLTFGLWRHCLPTRASLSRAAKLGFVQISDSLVLYGESETQILDLTCGVFAAALLWGVPVRGGLAHGIVNHAEDKNRPGTILSFYGAGLTEAYKAQRVGQGRGLRLLLAESYQNGPRLAPTQSRLIGGSLHEYPWWMRCGIKSHEFETQAKSWWAEKSVGQWFSGGQREDTKHVFERAIAELKVSEKI